MSKLPFLRRILKALLTKFCDLATFASKKTALWILIEMSMFFSSVFVTWRNMISLIFLFCIICPIDYWTIVNWDYTKQSCTKNRPLKGRTEKMEAGTWDPKMIMRDPPPLKWDPWPTKIRIWVIRWTHN